MKKLLVLFVALALMAVSVKAISPQPFGGDGWAPCNINGNYGGFASSCFVAWNGVTQACDETNRDATFSVGTTGMTTTMISIDHLNGVSDTDGFQVMDGNTILCTVTNVPTSTETWSIENCAVNFVGIKALTIHPTADAWSDCATYGQVAIKGITFVAAPTEVDFNGRCADTTLMNGWGVPAALNGVYGGAPYDTFCLVWEPTCAQGTETASVDMAFAGGNEVITIKHLDGMSNLDSFNVVVDSVVVGQYTDSLNPSEDWVTTNFPVTVAPGVHTITLAVTGSAWDQCDSWGQLAIQSIEVVPGEPTVPEFGLVAGAIALAGLVAGVVILRKKN